MAPVYDRYDPNDPNDPHDPDDYDDFDYVACYRAKMAECQQNGDDMFTAVAEAMNAVYRHAYRNTLRTGKFVEYDEEMAAENIMRNTRYIVELEDVGEIEDVDGSVYDNAI
jgi:hypothetical protein